MPSARRITLVLFATILTGCGTEERSVRGERAPVKVVAEPVRINIQQTRVEAVGTSRALQSVTLYPPSAGEIVAINFKPGKHVDEGDVLVELDQRKEKLAVELAEHRLSESDRLFERYRKSAETGATLPTTLDTARTELETARIELRQAKIALEDRNIVAPFGGHIGMTDFDAGDRVQTTTPITTLDNRDAVLITFELPERLIDVVSKGQEVSIQTWELNTKVFSGEIIEVDSRIDPELRTFVTRAKVENENDRLRPGQSFRVTLNVAGEPYPIMPEIAVQWGADGAFVWKIVDGNAERIRVSVVQRRQGKVMVDGPLVENDVIIVEGVQRLRPGLPVSTNTAVAGEGTIPTGVEPG
ncbi:MAG: efflux RND transporter periplasmic adaptor subunit [Pseudomonadales bacterium]|nr:efflux RND transporter periplasmic adaptor subunit [Pseudomonadales bacterium]